MRNTEQHYGHISKGFHWTSSILIITLLIVGAIMGDLPASLKPTVYNIHKLVGLSVLVIVLLRFIWTHSSQRPALPSELPRWMKIASMLSHKSLYLFMLIMPLSGWIMSSAAGPTRHPHIGELSLGLPIGPDKAIATTANNIHEIAAWIFATLIVIHIAAALYHHFVRKDNILKRMLPGKH